MDFENKRIDHEIEHGKKICSNAEDIWGWSTPAGKKRLERRSSYFIKLGAFQPSDHVLEIGCGTGLFTKKVYEATHAQIVAIDISKELIEEAKKKTPDVTFQVDDAMNLSLPSSSQNAVYGSSILHHLNIPLALREIFRVLKPSGRMIFAEPNMLNPQILIQKNVPWIKEKLGDSPDETAIIRWKMERLLKKQGFVRIQVFAYDFLHPATPQFLIPLVDTIGRCIEKIPWIREIAGSCIIYAEKPG